MMLLATAMLVVAASRAPAQRGRRAAYPEWTQVAALPAGVEVTSIAGLSVERLWVGLVAPIRAAALTTTPLVRVEGATVTTEPLTLVDGIVTDVIAISDAQRIVLDNFSMPSPGAPYGQRLGDRVWEPSSSGWSIAATQMGGAFTPACWMGDRLILTGANETWARSATGAWEAPRARSDMADGAPCLSRRPAGCEYGVSVFLLPGVERLALVSCERERGTTRYSVLAPDGGTTAIGAAPVRQHLNSSAVYVSDRGASLMVACMRDRIVWGRAGAWHVEWESRGALDCTALFGVGRVVIAASADGHLYRRTFPEE